MTCKYYGCSSISDIYCLAENVPSANSGSGAFYNAPTATATLHVPECSIDMYKETWPWSSFGTIVALTQDDIDGISLTPTLSKGEGDWYDLSGCKISAEANSSFFTLRSSLKKGINIIRHSDGTTRKVMVK